MATSRKILYCIFLIWNFFSIFVKTSPAVSKDSYEKIELINPLRLDVVNGVLPYESISKLIIAVNLPDPGLIIGGRNVAEVSMESLRNEFGSTLVPEHNQHFAVHSVLAKTSNYVFGTEEQMRAFINILNQRDLKGFSVSVLNSSYFENMMTCKLQESLAGKTSLDVVNTQKYADLYLKHLKSSYTSCVNRNPPLDLIGNLLKERLVEIDEQNLLPFGYKLAIPSSSNNNYQLYLNQSLTDCLYTPERIYVIVNIPVVRTQAHWLLYQAHHPRFAFEDKICLAGPEQDKFYAYDSNHENVLDLEATLSTTCKLDGFNQLCLIPPLPTTKPVKLSSKSAQKTPDDGHLISQTCAAGILNKLPLNELKQECRFVCDSINPDESVFDEVNPSTVILTNTRKARLFCPNDNLTKTFERIGAVKFEIHTCDCYLWADELFHSFRSCYHENETLSKDANGAIKENTRQLSRGNSFDTSYLVPLTWTKNNAKSMLMEDAISFRIRNYKEIIDYDWIKKMISGGKEQDEQTSLSGYWNIFDTEYSD